MTVGLTKGQLLMLAALLQSKPPNRYTLWHGPVGCGKTYLSGLIYEHVRYVVPHPRWGMQPAVKVWMPDLVRSILAFGGNSGAMMAFRDTLTRASFVLLEELGRENDPGGNAVQWVLDAIERTAPNALVLLVSNFSPGELAQHYGEAVGSRLAKFADGNWGSLPDLRTVPDLSRITAAVPDFDRWLKFWLETHEHA